MTPSPPVESFYSRKTLLRWVAGISFLWLLFLLTLVARERKEKAEDLALLRTQLRSLGSEVGGLRKEKDDLEGRYGALRALYEKLSREGRRGSPSPASPSPPPMTKLLENRVLRVGDSLELRPGRAYLALVRLTANRAELKLSQVGEERPASRLMGVADTWQFTLEGAAHTLLLQNLDRAGRLVQVTLLREERGKAP